MEDEVRIQKLITVALERSGYQVTAAMNGLEALARVAEATPDVIISDVVMPEVDGLELLSWLRADPLTRNIPLILLTAKSSTGDIVAGLRLGADDYLAKPFQMTELLARVRSKIERPPVPSDALPRDRQTDLLKEKDFFTEAEREVVRCERGGAPGCLALLEIDELPKLRERIGARGEAEIVKQVAAAIQTGIGRLDLAGRDGQGRFLLLLPDTNVEETRRRLESVTRSIAGRSFSGAGERARLTPNIGYAQFFGGARLEQVQRQAVLALAEATSRLDLHPVCYTPALKAPLKAAPESFRNRAIEALRVPVQIGLSGLAGMLLPFLVYVGLGNIGFDISGAVYLAVVGMLLTTAILIWVEGWLAFRRIDPPQEPGAPFPAASAIIAAYLPNEAATIEDTIDAFLRIEYPAGLQVILAYNTPHPLPVEAALREIARRDSRFVPFRVEGSTSKAQNVNAGVALATGEFVGIFDADHHPEPDSFARAWRWLSHGYDVVQGHCVIRNGEASWVARMAAVEFETIYALAHPGRARLHQFGIFGGSNGYWKTSLLGATRMRGFMLTEDIDSSLRIVELGYKIASDPHLISREFAPVTLAALWNQRMRWAQGWFQVSMKHIGPVLRSRNLSLRQKLGLFHLLMWREVFPWLSLQIVPILVYWMGWRGDRLNWFIPVFVFTTVLTLGTGPAQAILTYRLADADVRRRKHWFVSYALVSFLFYTELKNMIGRVAQIKEALGERQWKVTPRESAEGANS